MNDKERLANHIRLVQSLNDLELEVNLIENTLARPNISKAVCLNLSNSLRLSQERNRVILSTVDPNDSAARADTHRYFHLQAKIHELFIVLTDRIDQFPDPTVSSPPPSVLNPLPVKHNLPKISPPKFNGEFSEWENFWGLFSNLIHERTDLGNVIKHHYLLESLTDEPLELVNPQSPGILPEGCNIKVLSARESFRK